MGSQTEASAALYTKTGTDPSFQSLLAENVIPVGRTSTDGVTGSVIDVNNELLQQIAGSTGPIPRDIAIHTLCNSHIPRSDFPKWTRWYQEDGTTQVFRLFEGEHNVRNQRANAARIEAFSRLKWQRGDWHEWAGTYTVIAAPGSAIFQAKNNVHQWSVMINLTSQGDVILNHRRHQEDQTIATEMIGRSFHLKVRDNGHEYEVYLNGERVGAGHFDRPKGHTSFRWGMYVGGKTLVRQDGMIFVTGVTFK